MKDRREFLVTAGAAGLAVGAGLLATQSSAQTPPASSLPAGTPDQTAKPTTFVLSASADPYQLFNQWLDEAKAAGEKLPNAMTLATVDVDGMPDARMMLLKDIRDQQFFFTTHITTPKGEQLKANPRASLLFYWKALDRQVRIRGAVASLSEAAADAAWLNRGARNFKLNDWSWPMSQVFENVDDLVRRRKEMEDRFKGDVPRPASWSGYLLTPLSIEFFYSHPSALHERLKFLRDSSGQPWRTQRLVP